MDRNLIDYVPPILKEVKELKTSYAAQQLEIETVWGKVDDAFNDQFISYATENGISRLENIYKIIPKATDTLESRKFNLLSKITLVKINNLSTLKQQIEKLCGNDYSIEVDNDNYVVRVRLFLSAKTEFDAVTELLKQFIPANILIDFALKYNTYGQFSIHTHEWMAEYTHYALRNEVL